MSISQNKLVAIHQPNFLPWLGYFDKIARADIFVLLDNVQYPKKGGSWLNRVQMLVNGKATWITVPVIRAYHGTRKISEMQISYEKDWQPKMIKTIQLSYSRSQYHQEIFPHISQFLENSTESLAEYNIAALRQLLKLLQINSEELVLSSTLKADGQGTDLLISLVKAVGGTGYLSGGGAGEYQEDDKFAAAGLDLIYQDFQHPFYQQINSSQFVPGLSIVDALMCCGLEGTKALLSQKTSSA